jgi:hypothetical protein
MQHSELENHVFLYTTLSLSSYVKSELFPLIADKKGLSHKAKLGIGNVPFT